jgi:hypothetical protein
MGCCVIRVLLIDAEFQLTVGAEEVSFTRVQRLLTLSGVRADLLSYSWVMCAIGFRRVQGCRPGLVTPKQSRTAFTGDRLTLSSAKLSRDNSVFQDKAAYLEL